MAHYYTLEMETENKDNLMAGIAQVIMKLKLDSMKGINKGMGIYSNRVP